jgi:hypothetical protein
MLHKWSLVRMWKEESVTSSRYCSSICLKHLMKTMIKFRILLLYKPLSVGKKMWNKHKSKCSRTILGKEIKVGGMLVICVTILTGQSGPEMLLELEINKNFVVTLQQHCAHCSFWLCCQCNVYFIICWWFWECNVVGSGCIGKQNSLNSMWMN